MLASHFAATTIQDRLQLIDKIVDVLKFTIDRREAYKRDFVQIAQGTEDELTDAARRDFAFPVFVEGCFHVADQEIDLFRTDRAFVACDFNAASDFFAIEGHACPVLLDDSDRRFFNLFVGRESPVATEAFTSTANREVLTVAGVDDFSFVMLTKGTPHAIFPEQDYPRIYSTACTVFPVASAF